MAPAAPDVAFGLGRARYAAILDVLDLARSAEGTGPELDLDELTRCTRERAAELAPHFERRRLAGRGVDGHGDLQLQHVWFESALQPIVMDCVEFRSDLRQIDAASEVACLAMDLRYRGRADLAERFLSRYAWERDDFDLYSVVDYFAAYRAAVRGGVASVASREAEVEPAQRSAAARSALQHLELARDLLAPPADPAPLVLMTGSVGSGKSTVARAVCDALDGAVIGSDRTRKSLAGIEPTERGEDGMYTADWSERVYTGLLERAEAVVGSGRAAVLDATHARRADRARAARWAGARTLSPLLVEVSCERGEARRRLARRALAAQESDAGPERLEPSLAEYEPCDEWSGERIAVDTTRDDWRPALRQALERWRGRPPSAGRPRA